MSKDADRNEDDASVVNREKKIAAGIELDDSEKNRGFCAAACMRAKRSEAIAESAENTELRYVSIRDSFSKLSTTQNSVRQNIWVDKAGGQRREKC